MRSILHDPTTLTSRDPFGMECDPWPPTAEEDLAALGEFLDEQEAMLAREREELERNPWGE